MNYKSNLTMHMHIYKQWRVHVNIFKRYIYVLTEEFGKQFQRLYSRRHSTRT